jgi:hypothetical protein
VIETWLQTTSVLIAVFALGLKLHMIEKNHLNHIEKRLDDVAERVARIEGKLES